MMTFRTVISRHRFGFAILLALALSGTQAFAQPADAGRPEKGDRLAAG